LRIVRKRRHKATYMRRLSNVIRIQANDDVGPCGFDASIRRRGGAKIGRIDHDADARIALLQCLKYRVLTGSVIDNNEFEIAKFLSQNAIDGFIKKAQIVVDGHDDRYPRTARPHFRWLGEHAVLGANSLHHNTLSAMAEIGES